MSLSVSASVCISVSVCMYYAHISACALFMHMRWHMYPLLHTYSFFRLYFSCFCRLEREICGFAACEMIRRIVGIAKVEDLEGISDQNRKAYAEFGARKQMLCICLKKHIFCVHSLFCFVWCLFLLLHVCLYTLAICQCVGIRVRVCKFCHRCRGIGVNIIPWGVVVVVYWR